MSPAFSKLIGDRHDDGTARRERRKEARPGELLEAALDLWNKGYAAHIAAQAKAVLCNDGVPRMPAAEQTLKIVWQSAGRPHLYGQGVGLFGDCGLD